MACHEIRCVPFHSGHISKLCYSSDLACEIGVAATRVRNRFRTCGKNTRTTMPRFSKLTPPQQAKLRDDLRVFIAEKDWEGCNGLKMSDEVQVTIAANACLLALELPEGMFDRVRTRYWSTPAITCFPIARSVPTAWSVKALSSAAWRSVVAGSGGNSTWGPPGEGGTKFPGWAQRAVSRICAPVGHARRHRRRHAATGRHSPTTSVAADHPTSPSRIYTATYATAGRHCWIRTRRQMPRSFSPWRRSVSSNARKRCENGNRSCVGC